jgi:MFS transporter, putative metabolite:H+ symporter
LALKQELNRNTVILIIVAALGYFVDIYDLILFNVVKKESLIALGITEFEAIKSTSMTLFNWQMGGMLLGGILWGVLGDKRGRIKVLFGSILMYSAANMANAFVTDIDVYAFVRFIAGIGLAGELGAGITLVSEVMSKENRGYGTMIIVTFGALGAVLAAVVGGDGHAIRDLLQNSFDISLQNWQVAYIIGGLLGLMLLMLRIGTLESGMFTGLAKHQSKRGDFLSLFKQKRIFKTYLNCILIGLPVWYAVAILVALAEDFASPEILNVSGNVINGQAVMYAYLGLSAGDLLSGLLSQWWRSRKKVVLLYLILTIVLVLLYLFTTSGQSAEYFYIICFFIGIATGYWALFVSIASEQFGTNIRSTVTTTVPNFVRGAVIPITAGFKLFEAYFGSVNSALIMGVICVGLAIYALKGLDETFAKDLDYIETL